jgi:hypothetical protein
MISKSDVNNLQSTKKWLYSNLYIITKNNFFPIHSKKLTLIWQCNLCTYFRDTRYLYTWCLNSTNSFFYRDKHFLIIFWMKQGWPWPSFGHLGKRSIESFLRNRPIVQIFYDFLHNFAIFKILLTRHRHQTSNPPELLEFIKYGPFLIFWCIFCRNRRKIGFENEVCFEACRMPNYFWLFYDSLIK